MEFLSFHISRISYTFLFQNLEEKHALKVQLEMAVEDYWGQFQSAMKNYEVRTNLFCCCYTVANTIQNIYYFNYYIPRRKSGIYWIQVRRAAAVEISLWTR